MKRITFPLVAVLFAGCLSGTLLAANADQTITGPSGERFGYQIESRFDFSLDSQGWFPKLVSGTAISAPDPGAGRVYIFDDSDLATGADLDPANAWVFQGAVNGEAGWALAAGDITADLGTELVIAEPGGASNKGQVHLLSFVNGDPANQYIQATITGKETGDFFGWDVATGNIDDDAFDDLVVGACGRNGSAGAVYVFYGPLSGTLDTDDADITIDGEQPHGLFGCEVTTAALDGDWRDEVIVGAYQESADGLSANGRIHIFWNPVDGKYNASDINAQTIFHGDSNIANLGFSLDGGGDADGDGYEDLLVGAPSAWCHDSQVNNPSVYINSKCGSSVTEGVAYILTGKAREEWTLDGNASESIGLHASGSLSGVVALGEVGYSVAFVGDLNAGGSDEMFVGARGLDEGYLAHGSLMAHLDTQNAMVTQLRSNDSDAVMGTEGAYLGDINGDGLDDILVMAPGQMWYNQPTETKGVGYIWLGQK